MKRLIILVLVVCLCAGMIVPIHAVEGMTVSAEEVTVEPGEKFAVNIAVDNNSGFAYLKIRLTYDSNLFEFHNKESKSLSSALILTAGPALVSWDSSSDFTADQEIGTLWFTASESIAAGTYTIGVSVVECYDINTDDVQTIAQAITVKVGASAPAVDSVKPVINHTKVTNAKSGEAVSLAANVTDNVGVTSVKLYWRATNGAWNTVAMSNTTGSEYVATIAGTNVTTAGIEYYIEASDGVNTASEGSAAAPIAIAVEPEVDSVLPVLTHNRITSANEGKAISFTTTATDNVGIAYVKLYWRVTNGAWSAIDMTCVEGNIYAATIAGTNVTTDGIEYYIEASDATNTVSEGSAAAPIKVNVESSTTPDNVKPTLSHDRVTKGSNGQPINISATASDNKGLEYVKLYWRVTNGTWNVIDMTNTYGDNYVATIAGENVTTAGIEYYIEISDGTSIVCEASASYPVSITIEYKLGIYSVTPNTIDASAVSNNVVATLVGYNFSETMKLTVGGEAIDYIFVNSSTITFVIPRGNLISADIKLVDGSRVATLNNAITYTDKNSKIEIVAPGVAKPGEVIKLPIIITATGEIFSIEMKLQLTNSHQLTPSVFAASFKWKVISMRVPSPTLDLIWAISSAQVWQASCLKSMCGWHFASTVWLFSFPPFLFSFSFIRKMPFPRTRMLRRLT